MFVGNYHSLRYRCGMHLLDIMWLVACTPATALSYSPGVCCQEGLWRVGMGVRSGLLHNAGVFT